MKHLPDMSDDNASFPQNRRSSSSDLGRDIAIKLAELQGEQRATDAELVEINHKLEARAISAQEQYRSLEQSVSQIRDIARDALHVTIGVDGKNGLRGTLDALVKDVGNLTREFSTVQETAKNYKEVKDTVVRFFAGFGVVLLAQFFSCVWYLSNEHVQRENMRTELNRVISYIDKLKTSASNDPRDGNSTAAVPFRQSSPEVQQP